jgi:hypothetical protein
MRLEAPNGFCPLVFPWSTRLKKVAVAADVFGFAGGEGLGFFFCSQSRTSSSSPFLSCTCGCGVVSFACFASF